MDSVTYCDPLVDNDVPCTCTTIFGFTLSLIELIGYTLVLIVFLYKSCNSKQQRSVYVISLLILVGFVVHFS